MGGPLNWNTSFGGVHRCSGPAYIECIAFFSQPWFPNQLGASVRVCRSRPSSRSMADATCLAAIPSPRDEQNGHHGDTTTSWWGAIITRTGRLSFPCSLSQVAVQGCPGSATDGKEGASSRVSKWTQGAPRSQGRSSKGDSKKP